MVYKGKNLRSGQEAAIKCIEVRGYPGEWDHSRKVLKVCDHLSKLRCTGTK